MSKNNFKKMGGDKPGEKVGEWIGYGLLGLLIIVAAMFAAKGLQLLWQWLFG